MLICKEKEKQLMLSRTLGNPLAAQLIVFQIKQQLQEVELPK